ncbi:Hpt domain-containing protein [Aquabacterium sp.]|uniref:hybrid sensor histidine kinase/response regulator n=1 Tax=Aquabacterium sp. TaxID=1872578 RepID=UPI003B68E47C
MDSLHLDASSPSDDLSALAWVHEELRKSLDAAHKALHRCLKEVSSHGLSDMDSLDPAVLRTARQQIHQSVGALELAGLSAGATLLRASEAVVQKLVNRPQSINEEVVREIERASFALLDYIGRRLAGKSVSAMSMFPQYEVLVARSGGGMARPTDLWAQEWPSLSLEAPLAPPEGVMPRAADAATVSEFEHGLLKLLRRNQPADAVALAKLCAELATDATQRQAHRESATWMLASGFLEGLAGNHVPLSVHAKRVLSSLLSQLRVLVKGKGVPSDRLASELLFFCAQAGEVPSDHDSVLARVRRTFGLQRHKPVNLSASSLGKYDPAWITQALKRVAGAKDGWSAVAADELLRLGGLNEQFALVCDSLRRLFPQGDELADALSQAAQTTVTQAKAPEPSLAMEVATSLLYIEACLEDGEFDQPEQQPRVLRLAERIRNVAQGQPAQPLESWMEELYRRVSDRQTIGSVVEELRGTLTECEKHIDEFFRAPQERSPLAAVPSLLQSMRGVLAVLGMDLAAQATVRMRDDINLLLLPETDLDQAAQDGVFDRLASNLGALGFLIDMVGVQPTLAKSLFQYDEASGILSPVMGREKKTVTLPEDPVEAVAQHVEQIQLEEAQAAAEDVVLALQSDEASLSDVSEHLQKLVETPHVQEQTDLADSLAAAQAALATAQSSDDSDAVAAAREQVAQVLSDFTQSVSDDATLDLTPAESAPAPAPLMPAAVAAPVETGLEEDDEMRDIFLEEAREVIETARSGLADLARHPSDVSAMTSVRRAFHTLKGSSRMVGLKEYGEAGWACEQLYNACLATQEPAGEDLLAVTGELLSHFEAWTDAIANRDDAQWRHEPVTKVAEALRLHGQRLSLADELAAATPVVELPEVDQAVEFELESAPVAEPDVLIDLVETSDAPELAQALPDLELSTELPAVEEAFEPTTVEPDVALEVSEPAAEVIESVELPAEELLELDFDLDAAPVTEESEPPVAEVEAADDLTALSLDEPLIEEVPSDLELVEALPVEEPVATDEPVELVTEAFVQEVPEASLAGEPAPELVDLPDLVLEDVEPSVEVIESEAALDVVAETDELLPLPTQADSELSIETPVLDADAVSPEIELDLNTLELRDVVDLDSDEITQAGALDLVEPEALSAEVVPELEEQAHIDVPGEEVVVPNELPAIADGAEPADSIEVSDAVDVDDEQVKVVGPLRISIPLFNIYLNEADEQSRRLSTALSEWALEFHAPVGDDAVALAHSLAGNSATVGYAELSQLARLLEHSLMRSQTLGGGDEATAELFNDAAEEIRRLLHQFAAGFLKTPSDELMQRLEHYDHDASRRIEAQSLVGDLDVPSGAIPLDDGIPTMPAGERPHLRLVRADEALSESLPSEVSASDVVEEPVVEETVSDAPVSELAQLVQPVALGVAEFKSLDELPQLPSSGAVSVTASDLGHWEDEADIDAVDHVDVDLFPIFEEEAQELLPQLATEVRQWAQRPDDVASATACMRTLHTFKGGARLSGAMRLGELAHRLESTIERLLASEQMTAQDVEPLEARVDRLIEVFEGLQKQDAQAYEAEVQRVEAEVAHEVVAPTAVEALPEPDLVLTDSPLNVDSDLPLQDLVQDESGEVVAMLAEAEQAADGSSGEDASSEPVRATGLRQAPELKLNPINWAALTASGWQSSQRVVRDMAQAASQAAVRVRPQLLDRLVNHAGEVSITRTRLESQVGQIRGSLNDLTDNLERLRQQLRDIELQAETQMSTRMEAARAASQDFDPLEFDRYTRFQELTRMMAESVNDVATVQRTLQRNLETAEDQLAAQARLTRDLQDDLLRTRMVEFEGVSDRLYRVVRLAAKETGKQVRLDIVGGATEIDRGVLDRMTGAFEHLLRNCISHGIESPEVRLASGKDAAGLVTVSLRQEGNEVAIEFRDDGAGLNLPRIREKAEATGLISASDAPSDNELAQLIFTPGFTTADRVTELAGRGIGMDVVRSEVNAMGGRIETATSPGRGTSFTLVLPLTTAVTQVVMLRCGAHTVAVPTHLVELVRRARPAEVDTAYQQGSFAAGDQLLSFYWLGSLLDFTPRSQEMVARTLPIVIMRSAAQRIALHVDEVLGNQEVVVKNLGTQLSRMPGLAGLTLLASGAVSLIYNPVALATVYGARAHSWTQQALEASHLPEADLGTTTQEAEAEMLAPLVLVVDDSLTVRRVTQRLLAREGYRVALAKDSLEALEMLAEERPSVVLSDIEMPRMDGFDLVRNIRADAKLADLPVIMITSRIAQKHRDYAVELGVNHYLGKPYGEEELLALVAQYVAGQLAAV